MVNTLEEKIKFIVGIFKIHQPNLSIPEQIALLTLWEISFVKAEEYEMASAIIEELRKIQENPLKVPQKVSFLTEGVEFLEQNPLHIIENEGFIFEKNNKKTFFKKILYWFKNLFKHN